MKKITLRFVASYIVPLVLLAMSAASLAQAEERLIVADAAVESQLDLAQLKFGLRETEAIGFLTKLSLKNQLEQLLSQFAHFHDGRGGHDLETLRQQFEALFAMTLDLVREEDPFLHDYLISARMPLWQTVRDPNLFRQAAMENAPMVTASRRW